MILFSQSNDRHDYITDRSAGLIIARLRHQTLPRFAPPVGWRAALLLHQRDWRASLIAHRFTGIALSAAAPFRWVNKE